MSRPAPRSVASGSTVSVSGSFDSSLSDLTVGGKLVTNGYTQTAGTVKAYIGGDPIAGLVSSSVQATDGSGNFTSTLSLGGALEIDCTALGSGSFAIDSTWNLFQGVNSGSTNFSSAALTNVDPSSPYFGLSFTQDGTVFRTGTASDNTYREFQALTGDLVVVPEPSRIVFAGIGVAICGWTMLQTCRRGKPLFSAPHPPS